MARDGRVYPRYDELRRLGVCTKWCVEDADDVRADNRSHWDAIRGGYARVSDVPGFERSLLGLYEQGYSITDISCFFGVTRERARQWMERLGVPGGYLRCGSMPRVFNHDTNRFEAVTVLEYVNLCRRPRSKTTFNRAWSRALDVERLWAVMARIGRVPCVAQVWPTMSERNTVGQRWREGDSGYAEGWDAVYKAAGYPFRPDGRLS